MRIIDQPEARAAVFEHIERVESDPSFGEHTEQMVQDYAESLDIMMAQSHETRRRKKDLATVLNTSPGRLEALFVGKSVLDVGCGEGAFDLQLAENRRTQVTALDHNPRMLRLWPDRPNIRKVVGSGYDLQESLGDEEFDVVLVAYSSLTWAGTAEQAEQSIHSALRACRLGGIALFVPLIQHIKSHEAYKVALDAGRVPGYPEATAEDIRFVTSGGSAENWIRSTKVRAIEAAEKAGAIKCAYIASAKNEQREPIHASLGADHPYEDFSVIATLLEK